MYASHLFGIRLSTISSIGTTSCACSARAGDARVVLPPMRIFAFFDQPIELADVLAVPGRITIQGLIRALECLSRFDVGHKRPIPRGVEQRLVGLELPDYDIKAAAAGDLSPPDHFESLRRLFQSPTGVQSVEDFTESGSVVLLDGPP